MSTSADLAAAGQRAAAAFVRSLQTTLDLACEVSRDVRWAFSNCCKNQAVRIGKAEAAAGVGAGAPSGLPLLGEPTLTENERIIVKAINSMIFCGHYFADVPIAIDGAEVRGRSA